MSPIMLDSKQAEELQSAIQELTQNLSRISTILGGQQECQPAIQHQDPPADEVVASKEESESAEDRHSINHLLSILLQERLRWSGIRDIDGLSTEARNFQCRLPIGCIKEDGLCRVADLPNRIPQGDNWQEGMSDDVKHILGHNGASIVKNGFWKKEALSPRFSILSFGEFIALSKWLQSPEEAVRLVLAYINPPSDILQSVRLLRSTEYTLMPCCLKPDDGRLLMEFSLRHWDLAIRNEEGPELPETGGLVIERRVKHKFRNRDLMSLDIITSDIMSLDMMTKSFVEARSILAVNSSGSYKSPEYVTIILTDRFSRFPKVEEVAADELCRRYGLRCGMQPDAITYFLARVVAMFETSQEVWLTVTDVMDDVSSLKAHNIFNLWSRVPNNKSTEAMFDRSFEQSKNCFALLQFLKIAVDYVSESKDSFNSLQRTIRDMSPTNRHMGENVLYNLKETSKLVDDLTEKTLQRLQQRIYATMRLRDAIFSATSLKEAHEAMKLNRAVYVFTIVTVLYAPLGFLATFWALPFLNDATENTKVPESTAFLASFIIIPLLTYTACLPPVTRGFNRLWERFWNPLLPKALVILLLLLSTLMSRTLAGILITLFYRLFDSDELFYCNHTYIDGARENLNSLMNDVFKEPVREKVEFKLLWRLFRPIRWVRAKMKTSPAEGSSDV